MPKGAQRPTQETASSGRSHEKCGVRTEERASERTGARARKREGCENRNWSRDDGRCARRSAPGCPREDGFSSSLVRAGHTPSLVVLPGSSGWVLARIGVEQPPLASLARTSGGTRGIAREFPRIFARVRYARDGGAIRPPPSRRAVLAWSLVVSRRRSRRRGRVVRSRRVARLVSARVHGPWRSSPRSTATRTWSDAARATARAPSTASE